MPRATFRFSIRPSHLEAYSFHRSPAGKTTDPLFFITPMSYPRLIRSDRFRLVNFYERNSGKNTDSSGGHSFAMGHTDRLIQIVRLIQQFQTPPCFNARHVHSLCHIMTTVSDPRSSISPVPRASIPPSESLRPGFSRASVRIIPPLLIHSSYYRSKAKLNREIPDYRLRNTLGTAPLYSQSFRTLTRNMLC
jgi:hypothetical protein